MNRDKAIKKIAREGYISIEHAEELYDSIINKPAVPQYVADWYEDNKDNLNEAIWEYWVNWDDANWDDFYRWMSQPDENGVITTLVNMHQFGYEVEKEKRYTVRIRNLDDEETYLNYDNFRETWVFYSRDNTDRFRTTHTKKELEEGGFGWVFDCEGVEVIEVDR
ncbi:DUF1642 domain-containing protein [Streptococcus phage 5093]|uniref:DUF1642 domain-containing protein n=1 Tax=Streptococcus phage 5093 TaxID=646413 RepID=C5IUI5_9CAUD|nr:DUF1642 domain-containing protein [Streptococcus phage 5093]ACR45905.1 unknown [Streptococcus phage 5093]